MINPNTPAFGEVVAETTSLDLPPALASILNMPTPGQQIPSFQEGGLIEEGARTYGGMLRQRASTPLGVASMIPNPINSVVALGQGAKRIADMIRYPAGPMAKPTPTPSEFDFDKYFPNMDKTGRKDFGNIVFEPDTATPQQPSEMPQPSGGGGMGLAGMGMGGMGLRPMGSSLPADRKKPTVTVEELSYAEGGMVGMEGIRVPVGAVPGMPQQAGLNPEMQAGAPMNPRMLEMQINQFVNRNPQQVAQIRQAIMEELQSGELTAQELNMIVQLATVAAQNPEMYPNVRNYAIQQGIAAEEDLPPQYDQGLVFILLLAARAVQQDLGGQNMVQGGTPAMAQAPAIPSMAMGGKVPGKSKSEPVIIEAHTGEYVIPKHVVDMKGKEFFDSLVEKYKGK